MTLQIKWHADGTMHRAFLTRGVQITAKDFGGGLAQFWLKDLGYVMWRADCNQWLAALYGSCNPEAESRFFLSLTHAKQYVEDQALVGITLNKLTRSTPVA